MPTWMLLLVGDKLGLGRQGSFTNSPPFKHIHLSKDFQPPLGACCWSWNDCCRDPQNVNWSLKCNLFVALPLASSRCESSVWENAMDFQEWSLSMFLLNSMWGYQKRRWWTLRDPFGIPLSFGIRSLTLFLWSQIDAKSMLRPAVMRRPWRPWRECRWRLCHWHRRGCDPPDSTDSTVFQRWDPFRRLQSFS